MAIGDILITALTVLSVPAWHLVVLYIIIFLIVIWSMVKSWGF